MKTRFPFHPFFFAIYAVTGVFQINANEIPPEQIIRPLFVLAIFTALTYFILHKILGNIHRAALLATLWIFWAIYFGHIYRFMNNFYFIRDLPNNKLIILILWTSLTGVFALPKVWKAFHTPQVLTNALNLTSTAVLILPVVVVVMVARETALQKEIIEQRQAQNNIAIAASKETEPDIYYIIVDGYGRQDTLNTYQNYDNQAFTDYLQGQGFYVASKSQSNYMMTHLSVSSSLNFEYINDLEEKFANSNNRGPYTDLITKSHIRYLLEKQGYQFINIEGVALFMRLRDADLYLAPASNIFNEFESLLLTTSIADTFIEREFPDIPLVNYQTHRNYIKYQFNTLADIPNIHGKKFIFVHIWAPHPPFVFDNNGNPVQPNRPYFGGDANGFFGTRQEYIDGYANELTYVNTLLKRTINSILKKSQTPPIIIIQGDHGPGTYTSFVDLESTCLEERFSILNAYYFPDHDYSGLSDSTTPVNSFRIILNQYFGANLRLLENKQYYVTWLKPYQFLEVTGKTNARCDLK